MRGSFRRISCFASVGDIQKHAPIGTAAAFDDLGIVGERHSVARGEFHSLGIVALHEPFALTVVEATAFTSHGFGDQRARHLFRRDHTGGMKLHHLHIGERGAGTQGQGKSVTGIFITARRAASPESRMSSGRENHRVSQIDRSIAGLQVKCHRHRSTSLR